MDDWGNNMVTIQENVIIKTIVVTNHLGSNVKRPKVLLCFDYYNDITNDEKDLMFIDEPKLFSIGTINLLLEALTSFVVNKFKMGKEQKKIQIPMYYQTL
jgi:hypothetical protein